MNKALEIRNKTRRKIIFSINFSKAVDFFVKLCYNNYSKCVYYIKGA